MKLQKKGKLWNQFYLVEVIWKELRLGGTGNITIITITRSVELELLWNLLKLVI